MKNIKYRTNDISHPEILLSTSDCVAEICVFNFLGGVDCVDCRLCRLSIHPITAKKKERERERKKKRTSWWKIFIDFYCWRLSITPHCTRNTLNGWISHREVVKHSFSLARRRYHARIGTRKKAIESTKFIEVHSIILLNLIIWFRLTFLAVFHRFECCRFSFANMPSQKLPIYVIRERRPGHQKEWKQMPLQQWTAKATKTIKPLSVSFVCRFLFFFFSGAPLLSIILYYRQIELVTLIVHDINRLFQVIRHTMCSSVVDYSSLFDFIETLAKRKVAARLLK